MTTATVRDIPPVMPVVCDTCGAAPCVNPSFCTASRKADAQRRIQNRNRPDQSIPENWERLSLDALWYRFNHERATPQTTIEAIMVCVRERGIGALDEAANLERLSYCDEAARAQINLRTARLIEQKDALRCLPEIT